MSAEGALYSILTGDAGVAALVGARVYPATAPATASLPLCVYHTISRLAVRSVGSAVTVWQTRIQVTCYGSSYAQSKAVADAVRDALDLTTGTWDGTRILGARVDLEVDLYDPEIDRHGVAVDVILIHT